MWSCPPGSTPSFCISKQANQCKMFPQHLASILITKFCRIFYLFSMKMILKYKQRTKFLPTTANSKKVTKRVSSTSCINNSELHSISFRACKGAVHKWYLLLDGWVIIGNKLSNGRTNITFAKSCQLAILVLRLQKKQSFRTHLLSTFASF